MLSRRLCLSSFLLTLVIPAAHAQKHGSDRYEIMVFNNWDRNGHVSIATERRDEVINENWTIEPKTNTWLAHADNRRIRVRATDRIKVRDDMTPVPIGEVARLERGYWKLSVRDVIRAQRSSN